eukprot:1342333-Amorphochlora_amoeboformis.AAC.2
MMLASGCQLVEFLLDGRNTLRSTSQNDVANLPHAPTLLFKADILVSVSLSEREGTSLTLFPY